MTALCLAAIVYDILHYELFGFTVCFVKSPLTRTVVKVFNFNFITNMMILLLAGLAAEGLKYDNVMGQSADLFSLQRLFNRSKQPLKGAEQQNVTRWAVLYAGSLLKNNAQAYDALMAAMANQVSVSECIRAIEQA